MECACQLFFVIFLSYKLFHLRLFHPKSQPTFFSRQIHSSALFIEVDRRLVPVQNGKIAASALFLQGNLKIITRDHLKARKKLSVCDCTA